MKNAHAFKVDMILPGFTIDSSANLQSSRSFSVNFKNGNSMRFVVDERKAKPGISNATIKPVSFVYLRRSEIRLEMNFFHYVICCNVGA